MVNADPRDIGKLRRARPWLDNFDLSDDEFYEAYICGARVEAGSDRIDDFIANLKNRIPNKADLINQIALAIAQNQLWKMRNYIRDINDGDVAGFIKSLGGTPPVKKKKKVPKKKAPSEKEPTDYLVKAESSNISNGSTAMTFSTMDEEEVKKIEIPQASDYVVDYNTLADDIISEFRYNEDDEILHKRLSNIIISRFRDVRDEMESIDALTKSRKIGGMDFTKEQASELLKLIQVKQDSFKEHHISAQSGVQRIEFAVKKPEIKRSEGKIKTLEEKRAEDMGRLGANTVSPAVPVPVYKPQTDTVVYKPVSATPANSYSKSASEADITVEAKPQTELASSPVMDEEDGLPVLRMPEDLMVKPRLVEVSNKKVIQEEIKPLRPTGTSPFVKGREFNAVAPSLYEREGGGGFKETEESSVPLPRPAPYVTQKNIPPRVIESQNTRRPIVDGIKLAKKLTGPIEELGEMTLIDFRRLSQDPISATSEIREKVKLLEEESYVRRMEGVDAWLGNEVNKFYRLLGQSSMAEGKNIEDVIKERLLAGKPTLSMEEFDAIMQLNKELRY